MSQPPHYYTIDGKGRAWMEVWIGATAYGEIYRVVTGTSRDSDTVAVRGKRYDVIDPRPHPHVLVGGVLDFPRDLNTQGYG